MSIQAINWAWALEDDLSDGEQLVLLALANYAGERGDSYPSQENLARRTRSSLDSVQRRLRELCRRGLIYKTHRYRTGENGGGRRSSMYVLLFSEVSLAYAREEGWTGSPESENDPECGKEIISPAECDGEAAGVDGLAANCGLTSPDLSTGLSRSGAGVKPQLCGLTSKDRTITRSITSPPSPQGAVGGAFSDFEKVWEFGATDLAAGALRIWLRLDERERALAIKWAPEFLALCRRSGKRRMSGANWLRDRGWEAFHAKGSEPAKAVILARLGEPSGQAWLAHFEATRQDFKRKLLLERGQIAVQSEFPPPSHAPPSGA